MLVATFLGLVSFVISSPRATYRSGFRAAIEDMYFVGGTCEGHALCYVFVFCMNFAGDTCEGRALYGKFVPCEGYLCVVHNCVCILHEFLQGVHCTMCVCSLQGELVKGMHGRSDV